MRSNISIHVPREGHDASELISSFALNDISIHVPREGHDEREKNAVLDVLVFLSTCPVRGTTELGAVVYGYRFDFYPRAP